MPNTVITIKKSSVPSAAPANLEYGEIAINYADGRIYYKNTTNSIVFISTSGGGGGGTPGGSNTQLQFNDGGAFGGNANLTFNKANNMLAVTGNIKLMNTSGLILGGTGEGNGKFQIVHNPTANAIDFIYLG